MKMKTRLLIIIAMSIVVLIIFLPFIQVVDTSICPESQPCMVPSKSVSIFEYLVNNSYDTLFG